MSELSTLPPVASDTEAPHWTARHGKPIIFVILTMVAVGIYLALTIPVSVFPTTDFPRIVVAADAGVFPIDQMLVMVTSPLEQAVNTVPGLDHLSSVTSRGTAEIDLYLYVECGYVPDLGTGERGTGASAADAAGQHQNHCQSSDVCGLPDHRLQPDFGQNSADHALGSGELRSQAAPQSCDRRVIHRGAGRASAGIQSAARPSQADPGQRHHSQHPGCDQPQQHDRFAGADRDQSPTGAYADERPGANRRRYRKHNCQDHAGRRTFAHQRRRHGERFGDAGIHGGDGQWKARGSAERLSPAGQQHGGGGQCRSRGDRESQEGSAPRNRSAPLLRPVGIGERFDNERSRCHPAGPGAGFANHGSVSAGLGHFAGGRPRDSRDHRSDVHHVASNGPELQPDDPRRAGRGGRTGDRRRHRGGGEHRDASRRRAIARGSHSQRDPRNPRAASRVDHHAHRGLPAVDFHHRSHRRISSARWP